MTGGDPRFDRYDWAGGHEAMLCFGPEEGPVVIVALPLFEEANRTRAFVVEMLRALARHGIGSVLPDLPGQGESLVLSETVAFADLRDGFAAAVARACDSDRRGYAVAVRSGTLLDADADVAGRWHLAPQDGSTLVRELARVKQAGIGRRPNGRWYEGIDAVEVAGNLLAASLLDDLANAAPRLPDRTVRLTSDRASADRKIEGPALWRRSEPGNDPALAQILAEDVADWIARCES